MQKKPHLLIMAAGMASRYGGVKQLERVGPSGEIIMDYSIHAVDAGFEDWLSIKREMEADFKKSSETFAFARKFAICFSRMEDLPPGYSPATVSNPGERDAVLAARDLLDAPLTVINADDYYGKTAASALCTIS